MTKLLAGVAVAAVLITMSPAGAQIAPPAGVAQGTARAAPPHGPPVVNSPVRIHTMMMQREMTRDEMVQHVRVIFGRFDTNHDGYITMDELAAMHVQMMGMHDASAKGGGGQSMDHHAMRMDSNAMFDRMDTNHDGSISRQEFAAGHAQMQERHVFIMHGRGNGGGAGMMDRLFGIADTNHDGRVSLQEAETAALAHFDRIDANHDGKITPEERRQAHDRMRGHKAG